MKVLISKQFWSYFVRSHMDDSEYEKIYDFFRLLRSSSFELLISRKAAHQVCADLSGNDYENCMTLVTGMIWPNPEEGFQGMAMIGDEPDLEDTLFDEREWAFIELEMANEAEVHAILALDLDKYDGSKKVWTPEELMKFITLNQNLVFSQSGRSKNVEEIPPDTNDFKFLLPEGVKEYLPHMEEVPESSPVVDTGVIFDENQGEEIPLIGNITCAEQPSAEGIERLLNYLHSKGYEAHLREN